MMNNYRSNLHRRFSIFDLFILKFNIFPISCRSRLSKCYFDSHESHLQAIYVRLVEPAILLVIILLSMILNITLWVHMQLMSFRAWREARRRRHQNLLRLRRISNTSSSTTTQATTTMANSRHHLESSWYRKRVVRLSERRATINQNSYNLALIFSNLNDLPYVFWFAIFIVKRSTVISPGVVLSLFDVMFILAHSLNFLIYYFFHHEFRLNTLDMVRNVKCL